MINLKITKNFIFDKYVRQQKIFIQRKTIVYSLFTINELTLNDEWMKNEIKMMLKFEQQQKKTIFDVIKLINYDVILRTF